MSCLANESSSASTDSSFVSGKGGFWITQFIIIAKRVEHQALLFRIRRSFNCHQVFATTKSDVTDPKSVPLRECFAHDAERLCLNIIFGSYEIGSLKECRRQLSVLMNCLICIVVAVGRRSFFSSPGSISMYRFLAYSKPLTMAALSAFSTSPASSTL
jgi:hypothetical protein